MKGVCTCGHTGGVPDSQHEDSAEPGHGSCNLCECTKYTWAKYSMNMAEIAHYLQSAIDKVSNENCTVEFTKEEIGAMKSAKRIILMQ